MINPPAVVEVLEMPIDGVSTSDVDGVYFSEGTGENLGAYQFVVKGPMVFRPAGYEIFIEARVGRPLRLVETSFIPAGVKDEERRREILRTGFISLIFKD